MINQIYLASPLGFTEFGRQNLANIIKLLESKYQVYNPFHPSELSKQLEELDQILNSESPSESKPESYFELKEKFRKVNHQLGKQNETQIKACFGIFAILNGVDIDSGVAAEIGYAYGLGKPIWGYRNDFRRTGENPGTIVNLQLEYFIHASGGKIFRSLNEVTTWLQAK